MEQNKFGGSGIVAGILAGGRSRRLGVDKAFIRWRGRYLLEHSIRGVSILTRDVFILAKDAQPYRNFGCPVLPDLTKDSTPLSGIVTVAPLVSEWLLLTACDIAVIRRELFLELWMQRAPDRAAVLRSPEGLQPFAALYPVGLLHMWVEAFERGRYRLQGTLEAMPKTVLSITDLEKKYGQSPLLVNVNSSDDIRLLGGLAGDLDAERFADGYVGTVEEKISPLEAEIRPASR